MANIIKALLPSGKAPSVLKAEIIELVKAEAPAPDLSTYATKEELAQASAVQRLALTAPITAISIDTWDINQAYALVITQDGVGGRSATYQGEEITLDTTPLAATITAWVHDGTGWVWRSSAAEPAPTAPAAWADGTTVAVGTVEATAVTFVFSQPIPARVAVQYRAGATDTWRTVSPASSTSVKVTGLTPDTSYPAFDFQLINAAGASEPITAQAFQTPVKPPGWEPVYLANFTSSSKIPLEDYTPELGATPVNEAAGRNTVSIEGGATLVEYAGSNYTPATLKVSPLPIGDRNVRLTCQYAGIGANEPAGFFLYAGTSDSSPRAQVLIYADRIEFKPVQNATAQETSGKVTTPPASGLAVLTVRDAKATLEIDGSEYRTWDVTFNGSGAYQRAGFLIGGNSLRQQVPVSPVRISQIMVEGWE